MNRILRVRTVMVIRGQNKDIGLQTQAEIDIGAILDILDSVRMMSREQNRFSKIN